MRLPQVVAVTHQPQTYFIRLLNQMLLKCLHGAESPDSQAPSPAWMPAVSQRHR